MKYLIDTLTKNVLTMAKNYMYLRPDDRFLVYDPDKCPIEGFDLMYLTQVQLEHSQERPYLKDLPDECISIKEGIPTYTAEVNDDRKLKSTLDFDKALEWCDCYVCFESIEFLLHSAGDIPAAEKVGSDLLKRVEKAMSVNKKIYLGHRFDTEFSKVIDEYPYCINEIIDEGDLEDIRQYKGDFFSNGYDRKPKITLMVGTSSGCGKFTNSFKAKKKYEESGEKVVLLETEETIPLYDTVKNNMYSFCRNFSDLTINQEIEYIQCLIAKIAAETCCDRIIISTQGPFGLLRPLASYINDRFSPQNVWTSMIAHSIGVDAVLISSTWDRLDIAEKMVRYFDIQSTPVEAIFVEPMNVSNEFARGNKRIDLGSGLEVEVESVTHYINILSWAAGIMTIFPYIPIVCDYMEITDRLLEYLSSEEFETSYTENFIIKVLNESKAAFSYRSNNFYDMKDLLSSTLPKIKADFEPELISLIQKHAKELGV